MGSRDMRMHGDTLLRLNSGLVLNECEASINVIETLKAMMRSPTVWLRVPEVPVELWYEYRASR